MKSASIGDSGTWFGEEQAKGDTNAALNRLTRRIDLLEGIVASNREEYLAEIGRVDHRIDLRTHGPGPSLQMTLQRTAAVWHQYANLVFSIHWDF